MYTKTEISFKQVMQGCLAWTPGNTYDLPTKYKFLQVVGEGSYGKVLRCLDKDTYNVVAIKIPKFKQCFRKEVAILKKLMCQRLDTHNIVKFHGCFDLMRGKALVFESLELSLQGHINNRFSPMLMSDIRIVIEQVATALNALQSIGVIHTDIKPDNIMLVDQKRPFRVKLIDFGSAIDKSKARPGMTLQTVRFRSPEIILGLPFSEAIDMWSVGCLLFTMLYSRFLFHRIEYDTLRLMIELLGQPPDDLLNQGKHTEQFFKKTKSNRWTIKTQDEYCIKSPPFSCLDDLKKRNAEDTEHVQCIELLKVMLEMDQNKRITPTKVLHHPFITGLHTEDAETTSSPGDHHGKVEEDCLVCVCVCHLPTETPSSPEDNSKEKKKNCFQRFKSWFKRKFFNNRVGVT